jgi:hypothetical protein
MSNSNVAVQMFELYEHTPVKLKAYTGSNFRVIRESAPDVAGFTTIATAISYRTEVARLVHNDNGFDPGLSRYELWIDSHWYSHTTDRQISHITSALYAHNTSRIARGLPPIASYRFPFGGITHRLNSDKLMGAKLKARIERSRIVQKGLHDHTRLGALGKAIDALEDAIKTAESNVPANVIGMWFPNTGEQLVLARNMLEDLITLRGLHVNDLRVSVNAMIALEKY